MECRSCGFEWHREGGRVTMFVVPEGRGSDGAWYRDGGPAGTLMVASWEEVLEG